MSFVWIWREKARRGYSQDFGKGGGVLCASPTTYNGGSEASRSSVDNGKWEVLTSIARMVLGFWCKETSQKERREVRAENFQIITRL